MKTTQVEFETTEAWLLCMVLREHLKNYPLQEGNNVSGFWTLVQQPDLRRKIEDLIVRIEAANDKALAPTPPPAF